MSITFDKVNDVINCGSDTSLDNMSARTYSAWINPVSVGENNLGYILGKVGGVNGWSFNLGVTNTIQFAHTGTTLIVRTAANSLITLGSWQHVLITWDGVMTTASSIHIYINGSEVSSYQTTSNGAGTINDSGGNLCIGNRDTDTARTFDGVITEAAMWNVILTSDEIASLYGAGNPYKGTPLSIRSSALKGYWPMNEDASGTVNSGAGYVKDKSGNENNGAQSGDPVYSLEPLLYPRGSRLMMLGVG